MIESKYCRYLINSLCFHQKNVRFCTTLQLGEILSVYNESPKELASKITKLRAKMQHDLSSNIIPKGCENCIYKNNEPVRSNKINKIDLYYWYHCNCGCFYCSYRDETKGEFSDKQIEGNRLIYDTLIELYKNNQIDLSELQVRFGGGELGVLKEFPKLIDLFLKNNVMNIWCESSGIAYSKGVEKILKNGKGTLTVAVCAGSRETYKKIKQRDKYNQVMKNLCKYINAASKFKSNPLNKKNIISKFIILHGFNDNIDEVEKWLQESKKYGLIQVEISMEFCWGIQTKSGQKVEDYNYEIFEYVKQRTKELGLMLRINDTSAAIMNRGTY